MLLETIYDDSFEDTSQGFRPNRSCHNPYQVIGCSGSTTVWHFRGIFVAEPRGL